MKSSFNFPLPGIIGAKFFFIIVFLYALVFNLLISGLSGMQTVNVLTHTGTIIVAYHLLKKQLSTPYLQWGLLIALMIIGKDTKDTYNSASAFLYVSAAYFMISGLEKDSLLKLFVSGSLVCVNFILRLPNIMGIALALLIFYYATIYRETLAVTVKKMISFISGFGFTMFLLLLVIKIMSKLPFYAINLKPVIQWYGSGQNSTGSIDSLHTMIANGLLSLQLTGPTIVAVIVAITVFHVLKMTFHRRHIRWLMGTLIVLTAVFVGMRDRLSHIDMYMRIFSLLHGLVIFTALLILLYEEDKSMKMLAFLSGLLMVIQPLASYDLYAGISHACWLCLPILLNYFFNFKSILLKRSITIAPTLKTTVAETTAVLGIQKKQLIQARYGTVLLLNLFLFCYSLTYTHSKGSDKTDIPRSFNNKRTEEISGLPKKSYGHEVVRK